VLARARSCWSATRVVGRRGATAPRGPGVDQRAELLVDDTGRWTARRRGVGRRAELLVGDASRWPARRDGAESPGVGRRANLLVGNAGRWPARRNAAGVGRRADLLVGNAGHWPARRGAARRAECWSARRCWWRHGLLARAARRRRCDRRAELLVGDAGGWPAWRNGAEGAGSCWSQCRVAARAVRSRRGDPGALVGARTVGRRRGRLVGAARWCGQQLGAPGPGWPRTRAVVRRAAACGHGHIAMRPHPRGCVRRNANMLAPPGRATARARAVAPGERAALGRPSCCAARAIAPGRAAVLLGARAVAPGERAASGRPRCCSARELLRSRRATPASPAPSARSPARRNSSRAAQQLAGRATPRPARSNSSRPGWRS
jgi:hypothetical protein